MEEEGEQTKYFAYLALSVNPFATVAADVWFAPLSSLVSHNLQSGTMEWTLRRRPSS